MHARTMADDAADGGDTLAVSAPSGIVGWTVDGAPLGNVSAHWAPYGSVIASAFGDVQENASIRTTLSKVARKTSSPLSDRRSSVSPIRPHVAGSGSSGYLISAGMRDALSVFAPGIATIPSGSGFIAFDSQSDIWQAIETVIREGFAFPTDDGSIRRMPFNPVAMRRAIDAAHKVGKEFHVDRLDDVISEATERAYGYLMGIAATASLDDVVTHDGSAHAPIGEIAGYLVTRDVRCGHCSVCSGHTGSRYVIGGCEAPTSIVEFVDAQRAVSRAVYASASASVSSERYVSPVIDTALLDSTQVDDVSRDCGHGPTCERDSCRGQNVIHASRVACEALGLPTVAANGSASVEMMNFIALALGGLPTDNGRRKAQVKLRALLKR